ncbi:MAG: glucose-6-phosphate dehydrogenase [Candidatus Saccharibacteria bacterium]
MNTDLLPSSTLVIFGITGDLAQRKLLPALYHLASYGMLPDTFQIVGVTRQAVTPDDVLQKLATFVSDPNPDVVAWILARISIFTMDLLQVEDYRSLRSYLDTLETEVGICMHRLFYLAIPAQTYAPVVEKLGQSGLNKACPHGTGESRLLIEKPFGYDVASAQELIELLEGVFDEPQTYRIDHYVAKETVQNIITFRAHNALFKSLWNAEHIRQITITATEVIGIENRVAFYEQTGALRDFIQSHLLQLLALVAMEDGPQDAVALHARKLALLQSIVPIAPNIVTQEAVRGQYAGYRDEVNDQRSITETYAALRLHINNPRWKNVPIILETGKALAQKSIEIAITFGDGDNQDNDNVLIMSIQPNEGVGLNLRAKKPGFDHTMQPVDMEFRYARAFGGTTRHPDAYERVLADALRGDRLLFTTGEEVLASWHIVQHVQAEWAKNGTDLHIYDKGSVGPAATQLLFGL